MRKIQMKRQKVLITGAAGFVGSHLCDSYLSDGFEVVGVDNLSTGFMENLTSALDHENFTFVNRDTSAKHSLEELLDDVSCVVHMAANADIRDGLRNPVLDLEQNTLATFNILESMRKVGVKKILFASSAAALGEPRQFPTPEDCATPIQTSLYGASKMACEGLISAYCEGFGFEGYIFRFVSLLGNRYSHGHVIDFLRKLAKDPHNLRVLGNGTQQKSYLNVEDCIRAMRLVETKSTALHSKHNVEVYNLGCDDFITVKHSAELICESLEVQPTLLFGNEPQGWIGDNPFVFLDTSKIKELGWQAEKSIQQSLIQTVNWLKKADHLL